MAAIDFFTKIGSFLLKVGKEFGEASSVAGFISGLIAEVVSEPIESAIENASANRDVRKAAEENKLSLAEEFEKVFSKYGEGFFDQLDKDIRGCEEESKKKSRRKAQNDFAGFFLNQMEAITVKTVNTFSVCEKFKLNYSEKECLAKLLAAFKTKLLGKLFVGLETKEKVFIQIVGAMFDMKFDYFAKRIFMGEKVVELAKYRKPTQCPKCGANEIAVEEDGITAHCNCGHVFACEKVEIIENDFNKQFKAERLKLNSIKTGVAQANAGIEDVKADIDEVKTELEKLRGQAEEISGVVKKMDKKLEGSSNTGFVEGEENSSPKRGKISRKGILKGVAVLSAAAVVACGVGIFIDNLPHDGDSKSVLFDEKKSVLTVDFSKFQTHTSASLEDADCAGWFNAEDGVFNVYSLWAGQPIEKVVFKGSYLQKNLLGQKIESEFDNLAIVFDKGWDRDIVLELDSFAYQSKADCVALDFSDINQKITINAVGESSISAENTYAMSAKEGDVAFTGDGAIFFCGGNGVRALNVANGSSAEGVAYGFCSKLYAPERVGYRFKNWYADKDFDVGITESLSSNQVVDAYAKWEANKYKVIYKNVLGYVDQTETREMRFDEKITLSNAEHVYGDYYEFQGWSYNSSLIGDEFTLCEPNDVILTAVWKQTSKYENYTYIFTGGDFGWYIGNNLAKGDGFGTGNYLLINDINLGNWIHNWGYTSWAANSDAPKANNQTCFSDGVFDGNGKKITYTTTIMNADLESKSWAIGLFPVVYNAEIKNLTVNATVRTYGTLPNDYRAADVMIGGVVGYAKETIISNCKAECSISFICQGGEQATCAGGIVGYAKDSYISGCEAIGRIYAEGRWVVMGGIASAVYNTTYIDNTASVDRNYKIHYFGNVWNETIVGRDDEAII